MPEDNEGSFESPADTAEDVANAPTSEEGATVPPADDTPQPSEAVAQASEAAPPPQPAEAVASDVAEASKTPGALHAAARQGKVEAVTMLIRQKVDVEALDAEGRTALQIALAAGHAEVAALLRQEGAQEPPAPAPAAGGDATRPAAMEDLEGTPMDQVDPFPSRRASPKSTTASALGSHNDLKAKTCFAGATDKGVLKRATYMTACSSFRSSPKFSLGQKGANMFNRSSSTPAPGTYNLPSENKSKFKMEPRYSFGGNSRFGAGENPSKMQPGPGHYEPSDPLTSATRKVGFGTSVRSRGNLAAQNAPGPGAYEYRSCMGQGLMFTAGGRHPTSYMRARSLPGPGAYNPSLSLTFPALPKCGFGTSSRDELGRAGVQPGPGTYEMQNFKGLGSDAPKFSATSRRKQTDLDSYLTPGPGTYNSHNTSFGY